MSNELFNKIEDLCTQCGQCCRPSVCMEKGGPSIIIKHLKCKYLKVEEQTQKSSCSIYSERLKKASWCLSLMKGFEKGAYPSDGSCPYTLYKSDYNHKKINLSDEEYAKVAPEIIKSFMEKGQPEWCSDEDWVAFINRMNDPHLLKSVLSAKPIDITTEFTKSEK